jgi:predicted nucleic acid-binding protein
VSEKVLVETDFLFALRPSDPIHKAVLELLEDSAKGILKLYISPVSPVEASLVMKAAGLGDEDISTALRAMDGSVRKYSSPLHTELTLADVAEAAELRRKHGLTFFDSIHASVSLSRGLTYISGDNNAREAVQQEGGRARSLSNA